MADAGEGVHCVHGHHTATAVPAPPAAAAPETRPEVTPQQALFNPAGTRRQRANAAAEAGMRLGCRARCDRFAVRLPTARPYAAVGPTAHPGCTPHRTACRPATRCAPCMRRGRSARLEAFLRRVLARHFASQFQDACMPHQYGLSTRTGTEAVSRLLRAATETCPRATISSQLMLSARLTTFRVARCSERCLPDASSTRSSPSLGSSTSPSVYTWCDDDGCPHEVIQGEGGEQGDPLMPAFYALASLAQHDALCDLQGQLRDGEAVFAFLDDVYIVALPESLKGLGPLRCPQQRLMGPCTNPPPRRQDSHLERCPRAGLGRRLVPPARAPGPHCAGISSRPRRFRCPLPPEQARGA